MKIILVIFLLFFFPALTASESDDKRLIELMGIKPMLQQLKVSHELVSKKRVKMILEQMSDEYQDLSPENREIIRKALDRLAMEMTESWSVEEAANIYLQTWKQYYPSNEWVAGANLNDPEIKKLIDAALDAQGQMNGYIQLKDSEAREKAFSNYLSQVKSMR